MARSNNGKKQDCVCCSGTCLCDRQPYWLCGFKLMDLDCCLLIAAVFLLKVLLLSFAVVSGTQIKAERISAVRHMFMFKQLGTHVYEVILN